MAPSDDGEALFHINDVRFGAAGKNILCVSCFSDDNCATQTQIDSTGYRTDLKEAYTHEFVKSENITAFMTVSLQCGPKSKFLDHQIKGYILINHSITSLQRDVVTVDLGHVTNAGFTKKWGAHKAEDDRFAIEVEVIASDSGPMAHDRIFGIHLAATIGDVVVIG